ncbi:MAG: caspase family protein [Xanthomonadales bacterium]|nr:caspase family protein [Xanthomonadales bacterium]
MRVSAATEAELAALRASLERERQESASLRAEVARLREALERQRRAIEEGERERREIESRLRQQREALGLDPAGLEEQRRRLERERAAVAAEREGLERGRAEAAARRLELERRLAELEARDRALERRGAEAEQERRALATELAGLREELARVAASAEALAKRLEDAEQRLAAERRRFEEERARLEQEMAARREEWELMRLLENQLAAKDEELRRQRQQVAELERQLALARPPLPAMAQVVQTRPVGPVLEILQPPLTLTRGRTAAILRSASGEVEVIGRVTSEAAIAELTLNGERIEPAAQGTFRRSVRVEAAGTPVRIAARDTLGRRADLEFVLFPQAGGGAPARAAPPPAQARGLPRGVSLGRFHALVIGNDEYQSYPRLQSARNDARAVARLLERRYGFTVRLLLDADRFAILSAINDFRERLGEEDNLLIYFAGHGEVDPVGRQGYWLPVDARPELPLSWISNTAISDMLNTMRTRHVLVVADSCYSGAMTQVRGAQLQPAPTPTPPGATGCGRWPEAAPVSR